MHLGTKGCQADLLLEFLRDYDADEIYLVGDIVDGWQLKSGWYWPQSHNDVVQKLMRKVRKGSTLVYVPGNHDEFLRDYIGMTFGGIEIADQRVHVAADGKRYLVIHATSSTWWSATPSGWPSSGTEPTPSRSSSTPTSTPRAGASDWPTGPSRPGPSSG